MLKLLSTLSRVGLTTLQDLVAGAPADEDRTASNSADDVWFRPARVQLLEDRRVLAVTIVPDVSSITANEGASVNLAAELQGGTSGQSYDVTIDWGDGSAPSIVTVIAAANGRAAVNASHTYADDGNFTQAASQPLTLSVAGDTATVDVTVDNVAPTIALTGNATVNEGATYTLNLGAVTDPGDDTVTGYEIDWGDGTTSGPISGHPTGDVVTHVYADNGSRTITVDLIDEDGTHTVAGSKAITVNNVAPTIALIGNATVNEGATYSLELGAVTDPGADTVTSYRVNWGDSTSTGFIAGHPTGDILTHTYTDNASRTITVDLVDGDGTFLAAGSLSLTVNNVVPTVAMTGNATVNEGSLYTLTLGAVTDPGADTVTSYRVNWGDGNSTAFISGSPTGDTLTHTYADNAARTISVDLVDGDGTHAAASTLSITVNNVAPTVALTGNATVNEGATYTLNLGTVTDPGTDTVTSYQIHWGDGTSTAVIAGSPTGDAVTHVYTSPGSRTITVDLTDEDGTHTSAGTKTITVNNLAPTIALTGNATVNEGGTYTLNLGAVTDAGTDTVTSYEIHWGDGTSSGVIAGHPGGQTATHTYADNGSRTITVDLIDADGTHADAGTLSITVNNVTPTIALTGNATVNEGATYTLNLGAITDPGSETVTSYRVNWGDGTSSGFITGNPSGQTATHTYSDNAARTITVDLVDEDGTHTAAGSLSITVNNVVPTVALTGAATVNEGATYTLNLGAVTDPGADTETGYIIHWGDGSSTGTISGSPTGDAVTHVYADQGPFTITVDLIDEDGTHLAAGSLSLTVNNVAPTVETVEVDGVATSAISITDGETITLEVTFFDPGLNDFTDGQTLVGAINWGDGSALADVQIDAVAGQPGRYTFTATHTYTLAAPGVAETATIQLSIPDGTATTTASPVVVTIGTNEAPVVTIDTVGPIAVNEGGSVDLTVTFTDDGPGAQYTVTVVWGDGSPDTTLNINRRGGDTIVVSHTYADNGAFNVVVSVTDQSGLTGTDSVAVAANNVTPTIALSGNAAINEGSSYTLNLGAVTDPGTDTVASYVINWGDGTSSGVIAGHPTGQIATHVYADNGAYTITVDLIDEDGTHLAAGTRNLTVNNVAPTIALSGNASVNEGTPYALNLGAVTDPGADTVASYEIHWGDGTSSGIIAGHPGGQIATHTYANNGAFTITVDLMDEDGAHPAAGSLGVTVANVPPVIDTGTIALPPINEGQSAQLTFSFFDPGLADTFTFAVDWEYAGGAISTTTTGVLTSDGLGNHTVVVTSPLAYPQQGAFTVQIRVSDGGGVFVTAAATLQVNDVPPLINPASILLPDIQEGDQAQLSFTFFDPGLNDTFAILVDWDGLGLVDVTAAGTLATAGGGTYSFNVTSPGTFDQNGTYPIHVQVRDTVTAAVSDATRPLIVTDVAPTILPGSIQLPAINEGQSAQLVFNVREPGLADQFIISVDWGDGRGEVDMPAIGVPLGRGIQQFTLTSPNPILQDGDYTVSVRVRDVDPSIISNPALLPVLTVNNVAPQVTSAVVLPGAINEGDAVTLRVTFTDPGLLDFDTATPVSVTINWDDGTAQVVTPATITQIAPGTYSFDVTRIVPDDGPSTAPSDVNSITFAFRDDDVDAVNTLPAPAVTVNNLPPAPNSPLTAILVDSIGIATLSIEIADPGIRDSLTPDLANWNWSVGIPGIVGAVLDPPQITDMGNGVFLLTARFQFTVEPPPSATGDPNPIPHFTIQIAVQDKDGGTLTATVDANVPSGIAQNRAEAPAPPPPLNPPQSVVQTIPEEAPTVSASVVSTEAPSSAQSSIESSNAQVVLREVLPSGRERLLGTFDENEFETVLEKLRGLPERRYRVYMVMPDGSERLIVDVLVRQGRLTDPAAEVDQFQRSERLPASPETTTVPSSDGAESVEESTSGQDVEQPAGIPSMELEDSGSQTPVGGLTAPATSSATVGKQSNGYTKSGGIRRSTAAQDQMPVAGPRLR